MKRSFIQTAFVLFILGITNHLQANTLPVQPHEMSASHMERMTPTPPLKEAGNDVFGTLQEAITALSNDSTTDWRQVDVEKLRQHLLDMGDMTINVEIVSRQDNPAGLEVVIAPTTARAKQALQRVLSAHPKQLEQETGWDMQVTRQNDQYRLAVTTKNTQEIDKIRGLGYIGLMASGTHHQTHHWAMVKGANPH